MRTAPLYYISAIPLANQRNSYYNSRYKSSDRYDYEKDGRFGSLWAAKIIRDADLPGEYVVAEIERNGRLYMSRLSFKAFCIENYSYHVQKPSTEVYNLFEKQGVLQMLDEDYEDLHGMGMEYLMQFFDAYLGVKK